MRLPMQDGNEDEEFRPRLPSSGTPKDENAAVPFLGQGGALAAAAGVVGKPLRVFESQTCAGSAPPPLGPRPSIPSSVEEGSLCSGQGISKKICERSRHQNRPRWILLLKRNPILLRHAASFNRVLGSVSAGTTPRRCCPFKLPIAVPQFMPCARAAPSSAPRER